MATRQSGLSRALEQSSQNLLQLLLERSRMDQQEAQFQQSQALQREGLEFQKQQFTEEQRASAFDRVGKLAPFLKPGTTIAENPIIHEQFKAIFPEHDPTDVTGLGGLVLNPETWDSVIGPELISRFKGLPPDKQAKLLERSTNKMLLGEALSDEEMKFKEDVFGMQRNALQDILKDPELTKQFAEQQLGFTAPIAYKLPDGKTVTVSPDDAARLSVEIWKHRDMMDWYRTQAKAEGDAQQNQMNTAMASELMKLAQEKKLLISRPRAMQIINAVHSAKPDEEVAKLRASEGWNDNLNAVLNLYVSGADLADQQAAGFLQQYPGLQKYLELGAEIEAVAGKEQAAKILPILSKQMRKQGTDIMDPGAGFLNRFNLGQLRTPASQEIPIDEQEKAAFSDAEAYRQGKITVKQIMEKWGTDIGKDIIAEANRKK